VLPDDPRAPANRPRKMTPGQWYRVHGRRREADGWISWPGGDILHQRHGQILVNTWVEPNGLRRVAQPVADDAVRPWLMLVHHVLGCDTMDEAENLELTLDWLAMIAASWIKPGWHVLITGPQGLGKDIIVIPLIRALGDMASEIAGGDVGTPFNPWAQSRFLQVNEMRQTTRASSTPHDQMNTLKLWDNTRDCVWINEKGRPRFEARNVFAMWITSNEAMPLKLDPNDRRFMVFDRLLTPVRKDLIRDYLDWLDDEDPVAGGFQGWELVHAWLVQRWAAMAPYRKQALTGRAPMTQAKADMIDADVDEVEAWMQRGVDAGAPAPEAWPDLVWPLWVHERLVHAVRGGHEGLGPRTHIVGLSQIGQYLAKIGAVRLNDGKPIFVHGRRTRLWAVRNSSLYEGLNTTKLQIVAEKTAPGRYTPDFDA